MVKMCASEGGLCTQKQSCLQSPGIRSAPICFPTKTPVVCGWDGVGLAGRNRKGRAHLAVSQRVLLSEATAQHHLAHALGTECVGYRYGKSSLCLPNVILFFTKSRQKERCRSRATKLIFKRENHFILTLWEVLCGLYALSLAATLTLVCSAPEFRRH